MTEFSQIVAVVAAGFACGFINTLAGSGSLITLPLLIFLGLPAPVANGTNRVAIVIQNIVAVTSFRAQKVLDVKPAVRYAVPAVFGAIIGARIAVGLDAVQMERIIGILMLAMLPFVFWKPKTWLENKVGDASERSLVSVVIIFFLIGAYGGFVQGLGWLTTEELRYSDKGTLLSYSPTTYKIPNISDIPEHFHVEFVQNPEHKINIRRSKAVGEPPLMLSLSVWVAVKHALTCAAENSIPQLNIPATGEEILKCLTEIQGLGGFDTGNSEIPLIALP